MRTSLEAAPTAERTMRLRLRDGRPVTVPMRKIETQVEGRIGPRVSWVPDFSGLAGDNGSAFCCPRCDGHAHPDGGRMMPATAGMLTVGMIYTHKDGKWQRCEWRTTTAACSCVFGAFRNQHGRQRLPWADDLHGVVPGLTQADWDALNIHAKPDDDYEQVAQRIGEPVALSADGPLSGTVKKLLGKVNLDLVNKQRAERSARILEAVRRHNEKA